jgi:rubrerythrin
VSQLKGSRTEKNLLVAFAGESQARNRYNFFAAKAREEGYEQIAAVFDETADQERQHARRFFGFLQGGEVELTASFPAGVVGETRENLLAAADGEKHEHSSMYPGFAGIARAEGCEAIAVVFELVAVAEKLHEKRFRGLLVNLEQGRVFKREQPVVWRCRKCGYTHNATEPPAKCPVCQHPRGFFEVLGEHW